MRGVFFSLLTMSVTSGFVIVVLIIARLALKRMPRIITYALWAVAGFRLVSPVGISSPVSLIPYDASRMGSKAAAFITGLPKVPGINEPAGMDASGFDYLSLAGYVWAAGSLLLVVYGVVSTAILAARLRSVPATRGNIHVMTMTGSPFVFGGLRPQIYIPVGLSGQEEDYVIRHEQTHINRHDHLVKMAAYLIVCLHWFNPLVWVAFLLMEADMELSCDEKVVSQMSGAARKDYSRLLLALASRPSPVPVSLAFSEGGLKTRIVHALNFRKHSRAILTVSLCLAVLTSAGLLVNRVEPGPRIVAVPTMAELDSIFDRAVDQVWDEQGFSTAFDAAYHWSSQDLSGVVDRAMDEAWQWDTWTGIWSDQRIQAEAGGYLPQLRQAVARNVLELENDWGSWGSWYYTLYTETSRALSG